MDGFKNSTKTHYSKGGAVGPKGAAKINKVMGEFKRGELHSGSKKGPKATNEKQAVAIALSEAKAPVKKAGGGRIMREGVSARPLKIGMTDEEQANAGALSRAERMQAMEAREQQKLMREARDTRKVSPKTREVTSERRMAVQRDVREPLIRNPLMDRLSTVPSQRGEFPIRRAKGGLACMPGNKK